jgi:very-short-patch-repair endonuclease/DNA polymerase III delta prime subunit
VAGTAAGPQFDEERIRAQLKKWQERLLDLTKGNPLLGLNRSRVSKLRATGPQPEELFQQVVVGESEIRLPMAVRRQQRPSLDNAEPQHSDGYEIEPGNVEFEATPLELARKLRRIHDNARTSVEERGVTTLHVTFGTLGWQDDWLGESVSPIWMVPAQLISKGPNAPLRLAVADEEMQLNPALELYLRERHRVTLPELPDDPTPESLTQHLAAVQRAVRDQHWTVNSDVWLSTFSFESLVIYQDLNAMADVAVTHAVVASLARATVIEAGSDEIRESLDELPSPQTVPIPVLPVDGSQLEALTYGSAGAHLVIHGPPGTGKSQTISNLIADALGRNKKVLFVSSKMAALNVVHQRLKDKHLDRFCLEAHSTKAGKAKIIEELRRTLEADDLSDGGRFEEVLASLTRVRADLNRYVRELHRVREPLGKTLYQAIGRVAKLRTVPELRAPLPWPDVLAASRDDLADRSDLLNELSAQSRVFDNRVTHPWRGLSTTAVTVTDKEQIEQDLRTVLDAAACVQELLPGLRNVVETDDVSISDLGHLQSPLGAVVPLDRLPRSWFDSSADQLEQRAKTFDTAVRLQNDFETLSTTTKQSLHLPLEEAVELLRPAVQDFSRLYRRVLPSYWKWRSALRQSAQPGVKITHSLAVQLFAIVCRLIEIEQWFAAHQAEIVHEIDSSDVRTRKALSSAAARCRAAAAMLKVLTTIGKRPAREIEIGAVFQEAVAKVFTINNQALRQAIERVDRRWPKGFADGASAESAITKVLANRASELLGNMPLIQEWVALQRTLQKSDSAGLTPFIEDLGTVSAKAAPDGFERRFYDLWISAVMAQSDVLTTFNAAQREELVKKFESLDNSIRTLAALHIQGEASDSARRLRAAQSSVTGSEVGILRRELQKRKKIKPLRKLFSEIPHALQALKPCMLMSPISVSTYLKPGSVSFDLVVFDEASQLPTPEGIAAILRAKQVIVAGDRNQLPPTPFFKAQLELDDDDEDGSAADEPLESLLDDAVATVPLFREAYLKWHYRSKDERLIKFSNALFYDNRLVTFPSACTDSDGRGVRLEYVSDGVWDRGRSRTNRVEARKVAELVVEHFTRFPNRSLGVVAMNMQQKEAIEDALAEALEGHPEILPLTDPSSEHEAFFVKSLENVQGDERDAMMISVGYGKDSNGHLSLNFGPLNMEGGWRRLNVLITRAKWQTTLVTSIRAHELSGVSPNNRGAVALRDFIAYAERHCELPQAASVPTAEETNDFEDAVATALRDRGLRVDQQVGASKFRIDLAIRDRRDLSRYVLGVECDGATYHSTRTARDRDILRQRVLESMGWRIHRIWSTEWFHDRDRAIERVLFNLSMAEARPIEESVQGIPVPIDPPGPFDCGPTGNGVHDTPPPARRYQAGVAYRKFAGTADRELLMQSRFSNELASLVVRVVEVEGPIHEDLLSERLKGVCGVERAGSNVQSNIGEAIHIAIRRKEIERRRQRNFLWKKDAPLTAFRVPMNSFRRSIDWIHRDEIALAILYLVEDQFGICRDELGRGVTRVFGLERATAEACDFVTDVANELIERAVLREDDQHRLSLPE